MRTRGNGTGCVTSYMTAKNKRRWRVRVTLRTEYYFERVSPSAVRTVTSAWKYCESISNLSLRKLNKGHIEDVMNRGYILIPNGQYKGEKRYASANTKCRIKSMFR